MASAGAGWQQFKILTKRAVEVTTKGLTYLEKVDWIPAVLKEGLAATTEMVKGHQDRKTAIAQDALDEKRSERERRNAGYYHELDQEAADNQLVRDRTSMRNAFVFDAATAAVTVGGEVVYRVVDGIVENLVAKAKHSRTLESLHTAAELADWEAEQAHVRDLELTQVRAELQVEVRRRIQADDREIADSPFGAPDSQIRAQLAQHTDNGRVPALLIAPFHHDDMLAEEPPRTDGFLLGLRAMWEASPWRQDAVLAAGFVPRPLNRFDFDLARIGQVVGELPIVLVSGVVRGGHRVAPALTVWNVGSRPGGRAMSLTFAPMMLPQGAGEERLAFEDALGELFTGVVGAVTDRFHLLRHRRPPGIQALQSAPPEIRQQLALSAVLAYDTAIRRGVLPDEVAVVGQAHILQASGLTDQAKDTMADALDTLASSTMPAKELVTHARNAVAIAELLAAPDLSSRAGRVLDELYRRRLGELYGGQR